MKLDPESLNNRYEDPPSYQNPELENVSCHKTDNQNSTRRVSILPEFFADFAVNEDDYISQLTLDVAPRLENYRNVFSINKHAVRPTLDELHQIPFSERASRRRSTAVSEKAEGQDGVVKFGWIRGVYMRCLLNIWGVMLFLRMGWMTGQAGIGLSIVVVALASVVTVITTLSMSAICTNGEVRGGGAYYMISRSLGPKFGGAIGIIFSFANTVAVAMYIVGAAETVRDLLREFDTGICEYPSDTNDVRIAGVVFLCLMTAVTGIGMAFENKAQIFLLLLLLVALMDYFVGACLVPTPDQKAKGYVGWNLEVGTSNFGPDFRGESFFSVFSVFFPSVTGILAGANISGDLRDPCMAIPRGTFLAIITTSGSYVVIIVWLGFTLLRDATGNVADLANGTFSDCVDRSCPHGMLNYNQVMEMSSGFGPLIYAGIFAATLSSALAALISAPRIFQALCKDKIFPILFFFAKGYGPNNDPRRASALVFMISLLFCIIAELNAIAPIISNFFMASYCIINYSCFHASHVKSPGFRPGFRYYNKWLSLLGAALCLVVMFIMNYITALVTLGIVICLYIYITTHKPDVNWGSSTQGQSYKNALAAIIRLNKTEEHVKNYRPAVLVLSGNPGSRPPLVDFASSITTKLGLMICGHIIKGPLTLAVRKAINCHNINWLEERNINSFYSLAESNSLSEGVSSLIQLAGLGKMRPNIALMGYKNRWQEYDPNDFLEYFKIIHKVFDMHLSLCILRVEEGLEFAHYFENKLGLPYCDIANPAEEEESSNEVSHSPNGPPNGSVNRAFSISGLSSVHGDASTIGDFDNDQVNDIPVRIRRLQSVDITKIQGRFIPSEVVEAVNQFQKNQNAGTIDVWWLYDDGGLTLLLPYLLTLRNHWSGCKLRVFSLTENECDMDDIHLNLTALLNKFRIDYSSLTILYDLNLPPSEESKKQFKYLIAKWLTQEETTKDPLKITKTDLTFHKEKTNRHIRLRELLLTHSKEATLIVMTLPLPRKETCPAALYFAWLEILTSDMPPFLLVRGNQTSVLTFYS